MHPKSDPKEAPINRALVARNFRRLRKVFDISQTEFAKRTHVDLATIYRIENQISVRSNTIKRICSELGFSYDVLVYGNLDDAYTTPDPYVVHDPADKVWHAYRDRRRNRPPENQQLIQVPSERIRLGTLGLAVAFASNLGFIMENGPGVVLIELFQETKGVNETIYSDVVLFCLRGEVLVKLNEHEVILKEHGAVGYQNNLKNSIAPLHPVTSGELPPLLLWIGANHQSHGKGQAEA